MLCNNNDKLEKRLRRIEHFIWFHSGALAVILAKVIGVV